MREESVRTRPYTTTSGEILPAPYYCSDITITDEQELGASINYECAEKCKPCLAGNPWANGTSYTKIEGMACSTSFFEREPGICTFCESEDSNALLGASIGAVLALMVFCSVLMQLANAHWEPEARNGVHAVIHFGECQSARSIATTWQDLIVQRFQFQPSGVHLEHTDTALEVGDRVLVHGVKVGATKDWREKKQAKKNAKTGSSVVVYRNTRRKKAPVGDAKIQVYLGFSSSDEDEQDQEDGELQNASNK